MIEFFELEDSWKVEKRGGGMKEGKKNYHLAQSAEISLTKPEGEIVLVSAFSWGVGRESLSIYFCWGGGSVCICLSKILGASCLS